MQWKTLLQKEVLENWRNKKWIWVPLVIMILSIMDPLSYYFLPEILNSVGGMPEGTVFEIPPIDPETAFMMSIESLSMYGALIIALVTMGTIVGERSQGINEIILAKPIRYTNYVTAKWFSYSLLALISLALSLGLSWYYTNLLFGSLSFRLFILTLCFYSLWFIFIIAISIFFNTFLKNAGLVIACTIGTIFILSGINTVVGHRLTWFPNQLTAHINEMLLTSKLSNALLGTAGIIIILILLLIVSSIQLCKRREMI